MKTTSSAYWFRRILFCLILTLLLASLTLPLLAKVLLISGDPIQPEKLDIRPIPVPSPPPPLANNDPAVSVTPVPDFGLAKAPMAVPVPTPPPGSTIQTASIQTAGASASASPSLWKMPALNTQNILVYTLIVIVLSTWMISHRRTHDHTLHKECL